MASSNPGDAVGLHNNIGGDECSTLEDYKSELLTMIRQGDKNRIEHLLAAIQRDGYMDRVCRTDLSTGGASVLITAVASGNVEIVQLLLKNGFNTIVTNHTIGSFIETAQTVDKDAMVKVLSLSCEPGDDIKTTGPRDTEHKTSADSSVSSSSGCSSASPTQCNNGGDDKPSPTAIETIDPEVTYPVTEYAGPKIVIPEPEPEEPVVDVDSNTRDAVFVFLRRRLGTYKGWKEIFRALGFEEKEIMELKFHYINTSLEECIFQGLHVWAKKDGADIGTLFGALCHEKVNQRILVDDLKRRFSKLKPVVIKPVLTRQSTPVRSVDEYDNRPLLRKQEYLPKPSPSLKKKQKSGFRERLPFGHSRSSSITEEEAVPPITPSEPKKRERRPSVPAIFSDMFSRKGSNGDEMPKVNGNKKGTNNLRQISEDGNTASSSKRGSTSAPSSKRDSSSLSSFRVEADIHNESTDESVHQSQPTTPRVGFADRTLVIHESGSEDGSPRISRKSKKENSSFFRRKVGILKSYSPTSSPVVAKKSTGAKSRRRRKMGHTSPEPPSLEEVSSRFQNCDDNTPKEIYMLPSSEREYPNGGITGSETSTEESTSSSRKTSSETQASSRIEDLHEAIDEKDQDDATRHLANAGKSIEILLQQYNENKDNVNYKMTELNADSNVCVVELVKTVEEESRHSHVRRQRSLSDSDIPVQRLFTKTKTGTFRMDFYFRHKSDNYGIPKIRQNSFTRRHSEQSFPNTEIKSDPVWQLRPSKRVVMFNHHNNHQPVYKTTSSMTNISTTI